MLPNTGRMRYDDVRMPYLERRIEKLLSDYKAAKLIFRADSTELLADLDAIVVDERGRLDLSTCSDRVRSYARAYWGISGFVEEQHQVAQPPAAPRPAVQPVTAKALADAHREYFAHLDEVFIAFTGSTPEKFADAHGEKDGAKALRALGRSFAENPEVGRQRNADGLEALEEFSSHLVATNIPRVRGSQALPGSKLVLGGTQRFTEPALAATRSMLLYTDTVLIADPVLPWLETNRSEEKFQHTAMLEQVFYLSRLRPLVDADLPYPAIAVFPSFEKSLEARDAITQDGIELLTLRLFSHYASATFEDVSEVLDLAVKEPERFADIVSKNHLFVPPEGDGSESFQDALRLYMEHARTWRSPDYVKELERMSGALVGALAIMERIGPQYHVAENAEMLTASPLFSQQVQWHYFRLLERADAATLVREGNLTQDTDRLIEALAQPETAWLGNVPINDLVELRLRLDNETFRRQLDGHVKDLGGATDASIDTVAGRVSRGLTRMLAEHDKEITKITEEYNKRHLQTAVATWISGAALFTPLFPLSAGAAVVAASKYAADKAAQKSSYNKQRRTLLGMLAAAANKKGSA